MIPRDHDYAGNERDQHNMNINCIYDGELIWIYMDGCHSWTDGCYTHQWTHAMYPKTLMDIVKCAENAIYLYGYNRDVVPQILIECGDALYDILPFDNRGGN